MNSFYWIILVMAWVNVVACRSAAEDWSNSLRRMPLWGDTHQLDRFNTVHAILNSLQPDPTVKGIVFMPGATDELYLFKRVQASITNRTPNLLDAVRALTNQTLIRATFCPPFLLLHSDEDPLSPSFEIGDESAAAKIKSRQPKEHLLYEDKDWNYLQYDLRKTLKVDVFPDRYRMDSFHFYRHNFAAWHLDGFEFLHAVSMAGKTTFEIRRNKIVFEGDKRFRKLPTLEPPPRDQLQMIE